MKETTKIKFRDLLKLLILIIITLSVEYILFYIIIQEDIYPILKNLNSEYGNILMVFVSAIMAVATVIYAYFAYKQYHSEKQNWDTKERPLIFPTILDTHGSLQMDYRTPTPFPLKTQRLDIDLSLKNIGNSLATAVLINASINYETPHEKVTLPLTKHEEYVCVLLPGKDEIKRISIYEEDLKKLLDILSKRFQRSHPFSNVNSGDLAYPTFNIELIYTNIDEKHFCSKLVSQIYWIEDISHPALSQNSLFENAIPPCSLERNATFKLRMSDSLHSVFTTYLLSSRRVELMMASWKDNPIIESILYVRNNPKIQNLLRHTVPIKEGELENIPEVSDRKK